MKASGLLSWLSWQPSIMDMMAELPNWESRVARNADILGANAYMATLEPLAEDACASAHLSRYMDFTHKRRKQGTVASRCWAEARETVCAVLEPCLSLEMLTQKLRRDEACVQVLD